MIFESVSTIPKTFLQAQYIVTIVHCTINTIYTVYILYYSTLYYIYCTIVTTNGVRVTRVSLVFM